MIRVARSVSAAAVFAAVASGPAFAQQVTIEPASPRWGDSVLISVEPDSTAPEPQRFSRADTLFAVLGTFEHGAPARGLRPWAAMTWDGRRFVARVTLPAGCEAGYASVASAEQSFSRTSRSFVCRTPDGRIPPGGLISGIVWGGRDRANWQHDVADDLAALRSLPDHGWEYSVLWLLRSGIDRAAYTPEDARREAERVEREEPNRTAGLLSSLVYGYYRAGEIGTAFERLEELCDRFPSSELTVRLGLYFGSMTLPNSPELEPELNRLLAQVATRAPDNAGLRVLLPRLLTVTPALPLSTLRRITERLITRDPADMVPHYVLAAALAASHEAGEAEAEASRAIDLTMRPHPYESGEQRSRQRAFALRAELRAARGDLAGAVADARLAQLVAREASSADDLAREAELWRRLGFDRKAEALAVEAYAAGSPMAETLLREAYVARTGSETGFGDHLIARLRDRHGVSDAAALRSMPSFSTTSLNGATIDNAALTGGVTVLDFWFTTCPPCKAERPKLNAIVDEFAGRVRFVGFALDSAEALRAYIAATPFKYEIVPKSQAIADAFGVHSFPTHMVVDRAGKIAWVAGTEADRIERLRAVIYRVLAR